MVAYWGLLVVLLLGELVVALLVPLVVAGCGKPSGRFHRAPNRNPAISIRNCPIPQQPCLPSLEKKPSQINQM